MQAQRPRSARGVEVVELAVVAVFLAVMGIAGWQALSRSVREHSASLGDCVGGAGGACGSGGGASGGAAAAPAGGESFGRYLADRFGRGAGGGAARPDADRAEIRVAQARGVASDAPVHLLVGGTRPDNPGRSGDWAGYFARRDEALAPLRQDLAAVEAEMRALETTAGSAPDAAARTEERYRELERRQLVLRTNIETTRPDFLSPDGRFMPGDVELYERERAMQAMRDARAARGQPALAPHEERADYERATAALSADRRRVLLRGAANEYRAQRAQDVTEAAFRARFPGATGDVLAQAAAMGMFGGVIAPRVGARPGAAGAAGRVVDAARAAQPPRPPGATAAPPVPPPSAALVDRAWPPPSAPPPPGAVITSRQARVPTDTVTGSVQGEVRRATVDRKRDEIRAILDGGPGALPEVRMIPDPSRPGGLVILDGNHTYQAYRELGFREIPGRVYTPDGVQFLRDQVSYPRQTFPIGDMRVVDQFSGSPAQQAAARAAAAQGAAPVRSVPPP